MGDLLDDTIDVVPWNWFMAILFGCLLWACANELADTRIELAEAKEEISKYKKAEVDAAPKIRMDCADLPDENGKYDCKPVEVQY